MPREEEPSRPAARASGRVLLAYAVLVLVPVLLFLVFLGSLPAPD